MNKNNHIEIDFEQYEKDFTELNKYEQEAEKSLKAVENSEFWQPSDYEQYYLPRLRLAGISDKQNISLQNSADLHMHTQWSDGDDLDKVLAKALEMKLDAIAITDHDEIDGAFEARRRVHERRLPIAIVTGTEISSADGHIGALFVNKKFPKELSAEDTVKLIHQAKGIAVAHHPYSPKWLDKILNCRLGCGDLIKSVPFDAIECTNAVPGRGTQYNIAAINAMRQNNVCVAVTGSSDAHHAKFVGKGKTYYAGNHGIVSLRNSIMYGFTQGAEGYWRTSEKFSYYFMLGYSIIKNVIKKKQSVN